MLSIFGRPNHLKPYPPLDCIRMIGRGSASKTSTLTGIANDVVDSFLPESGLVLGYSNNLIATRERRLREDRLATAAKTGNPQTLKRNSLSFDLLQGARTVLAVDIVDEVGQDFTNIDDDSSEEDKARRREVQADASRADVVWVFVPVTPANPQPRHEQQFRRDVAHALAELRDVVAKRPPDRPLPVAFLLPKCDRIARSAEEARSLMPDEAVRQVLNPLVNFCRVERNIADAAIFPTTTYGWGNSIPGKDPDRPLDQRRPSFEADDPGDLLRDPNSMKPFNLHALVCWSLLNGLKHQDVYITSNNETPEPVRIARLLAQDLEAMDKWIIPIKG